MVIFTLNFAPRAITSSNFGKNVNASNGKQLTILSHNGAQLSKIIVRARITRSDVYRNLVENIHI